MRLLPIRRHLLMLVAALAAASLLACGQDEPTLEAADQEGGGDQSAGLEHIHGLGVTRDDGRLFIATHHGLFTAAEGEATPTRVSEHRQDIMGFSIVDEDRFIGSGHPGPDQDLPPHLGLIESPDGKTWQNVSLLGEVDFHALEAAGSKIYGYDGLSGELLVSDDGGRDWRRHAPPAPVFDLAVDPREASRIVAATEQGLFVSRNEGRSWRQLRDDLAGLLAWPGANAIYLVDAEGQVLFSDDGGRKWQPRGEVGGAPVAFTAAEDDLYVALADGTVLRSDDGGDGWTIRTRAR